MMTCWIWSARTPELSRAHLMATAPRRGAGSEESVPRNEPIGVRARAEDDDVFHGISLVMMRGGVLSHGNADRIRGSGRHLAPAIRTDNAIRSLRMSISAITDRRIHVQPAEVHNVLSRHMLADGYDIVMDLRKSKGSWVFDSRRGRNVLDFFTNFASVPDRLQPSQDGHARVPRAHRRRGGEQARQLRHLHDATWPSSSRPSRAWPCRRPSTSTCSSSRAAPSASRTRSRPPSTGRSARTSRRATRQRRARRSCICASASTAAPATRSR